MSFFQPMIKQKGHSATNSEYKDVNSKRILIGTRDKKNVKKGVVESTLMIVHLDRDENCQAICLKEKACQFARQYQNKCVSYLILV